MTTKTWNPVTGCDKVSVGCKNCYAERQAHRLQRMGNPRYTKGFEVVLHWDKIDQPKSWRDHKHIFVNSMSDLFHPKIPSEFVDACVETMRDCPQHDFQVLTKRPKTALHWYSQQALRLPAVKSMARG